MSFSKIKIQDEINSLVKCCTDLYLHLCSPRSGNIKSIDSYSFVLGNKQGIRISKYVRNASALEKLQEFIDQ